MPHARYSSEEIVRRGQEVYDQRIRDRVDAQHRGHFLVLDIETGEYEIDRDSVAAYQRAAAKRPGAPFYILRVGHPTAFKLGLRYTVGATCRQVE